MTGLTCLIKDSVIFRILFKLALRSSLIVSCHAKKSLILLLIWLSYLIKSVRNYYNCSMYAKCMQIKRGIAESSFLQAFTKAISVQIWLSPLL
jgi:hypothetical protein